MRVLAQKIFFRLRIYFNGSTLSLLKLRLLGARIGKGSSLCRDTSMNWPHQVKIGANCVLENRVDFKFADSHKPGPSILIGDNVFIGKDSEFNITERITIGNDCLIGSGCKFIDHDHGMQRHKLMCQQPSTNAGIQLGSDVWLGANVIVLKGVVIEEGAVVAASAVVTKSIPRYEIWGGIPARKLSERPE